MKIYAQHGYGEADKIENAIEKKFIDGIIYSPRDINREKLIEKISENKIYDIEILFDPQLYVSIFNDEDNIKLRYLDEWDYYKGYKISDLELSENIQYILIDYFSKINDLETSSIISPNIFISRSFESREAVIAKNFIRKSVTSYSELADGRDLYASLIIDWEALLDEKALDQFLDDLTLIEEKPNGIYLIIGGSSLDTDRSYYVSSVISAWMKINYALSLNDFKVINGYSDLLTPILGAVGAEAGATGWWSNLRSFKLERFLPERSGGRMPIKRYLSIALWNRIRFDEMEAFEEFLPEVKNGLDCDSFFTPEPDNRDEEMLQSWEALKEMNKIMCSEGIEENLNQVEIRINEAIKNYRILKANSLSIDQSSNDEHLSKIGKALRDFMEWAEIQ